MQLSFMDLLSLDDSFRFFYGNSILYLTVACFLILYRIKYNEKSNRTSNTYLISRSCGILFVNAFLLMLFSLLNVMVFDFGIERTDGINLAIVVNGLLISYGNALFPYYIFFIIRKQLTNKGFFSGFLNQICFLLMAFMTVSFILLIISLFLNAKFIAEISFMDTLFKITAISAFSQGICFILALKDENRYLSELLHGSFFSKSVCFIVALMFIYLPIIIWPLSLIFVMPLYFIDLIAFIFVIHIISQARAVSRDFLTGMNNRNELYRYLSRLFEKVDDLTSAINLVFIDINKFKAINDTFGHSQGDKTLIRLANCLKRSAFEKNCFLCRYAGDEFIAVLKEDTDHSVEDFISKLNENIDKSNKEEDVPCDLSVAIGNVCYSEEYDTVEKFIAAADHKMYKIKKQETPGFEM